MKLKKEVDKFIEKLENKIINEDYEDLLYLIDRFKQKMKDSNETIFFNLESLSNDELKKVKTNTTKILHERGRLL